MQSTDENGQETKHMKDKFRFFSVHYEWHNITICHWEKDFAWIIIIKPHNKLLC